MDVSISIDELKASLDYDEPQTKENRFMEVFMNQNTKKIIYSDFLQWILTKLPDENINNNHLMTKIFFFSYYIILKKKIFITINLINII